MSFDVVKDITLASAVADSGTFTAGYPDGRDAGSYAHNSGHVLVVNGAVLHYPADFTLTFGASNITVTNGSGTTWPKGARVYLQLDRVGSGDGVITDYRITPLFPVQIDLGAPDTADPNGVAESQAVDVSADPAFSLDGALVSGGEAVFDVPRNVVASWTGTAVVTVTGEDDFGNAVVEASASGTSLTGAKAFKKVTKVTASADITVATVGTGDVLGLPIFLRSVTQVVGELEDNAKATAGTLVDGDITEATATTGDPRGTYDPSSAADGSKVFSLLALLGDTQDIGLAQYAG